MQPIQLLVILSTICMCALLAHRLRMAPPIAFLLGGILLALMPGMPHVSIDPEMMLVIFLPPILMEAAFFTSIRDFRSNLRPILLLAIGLVVVTSVAVASVVVGMIPGASWALGFVVGAIVSPPDAAAATAALKGVTIPKRITSILEGESLVNDATGIVLYKFAVAAVVAGSFSLADASVDFAWKAIGGIAIGLAVAHIFNKMYRFLREPSVEILATFVPPYAAYMLAESVHGSGVLAVVSAGLLVGWHAPNLFTPRMRIPAEAIWKMLVFFLNAVAFLFIGLQLPELMHRLQVFSDPMILLTALAVCIACFAVRFAWVFTMTYGLRKIIPAVARRDPTPSWQNVFVIAWTGMRGVVTLALAFALPLTLESGDAFPHRDLIIFLSTTVILFTLVIQGLTLPWLTAKLTLTFDPKRTQEEWLARVQAARKALAKLEELSVDSTVHIPALERIRQHYQERLESLGDGPNTPLNPRNAPGLMDHPLLMAENRIWADVLSVERKTLLALRSDFTIGDDVMHDMLREMDLLSARFHYHEEPVPESGPSAAEKRRLWLHRRKLRAA